MAVPSALEQRLDEVRCVVCGSGDDGDGSDPLCDLLLCDGDGGNCTRAMHVRCHRPERYAINRYSYHRFFVCRSFYMISLHRLYSVPPHQTHIGARRQLVLRPTPLGSQLRRTPRRTTPSSRSIS